MAAPRPRPPRGKIVQAAGAVIWRLSADAQTYVDTRCPKTEEDIEVLIVHRPKYNDWSWPKGKREPGESLLECATREVEEETGLTARLQAPLTTQRYRLGTHTTKAVYYWLGRIDVEASALRARTPVQRASKKEIDETRWVSPKKALKLLTRRGDQRLLEEVLVKLRAGTLETAPLIIVRHGKAISRKEWNEGEALRPLDREGVHQVRQMTGLFSAYGVSRFVTSPWRRCLATVGTYASLCGASVEIALEASEEAYVKDPESFRTTVKRLMRAGKQVPTALCVHRPTLPTVFEEIKQRTPSVIARQIPQEDPYLRTAEMLVCHIAMVPDVLADASNQKVYDPNCDKQISGNNVDELLSAKELKKKHRRERRLKGILAEAEVKKSKKNTVNPAILAQRVQGKAVAFQHSGVHTEKAAMYGDDAVGLAKEEQESGKSPSCSKIPDDHRKHTSVHESLPTGVKSGNMPHATPKNVSEKLTLKTSKLPKPGPKVTARIVSIERVRPFTP
ncbi:MAG: NUDIX hydrolase [Actinomycetaceae bacterium]|nr:NUDIX hydrolase [Actinomycetaceae bacterium]